MLSWTFDFFFSFFPLINVSSLHNPKYNGCNYLVLKCAMNVKAWGVRAPYKLATLLRTNQYNSSHFHVPVSNCDRSFLFPFFFFPLCVLLPVIYCKRGGVPAVRQHSRNFLTGKWGTKDKLSTFPRKLLAMICYGNFQHLYYHLTISYLFLLWL